jgi:hypothetical protein
VSFCSRRLFWSFVSCGVARVGSIRSWIHCRCLRSEMKQRPQRDAVEADVGARVDHLLEVGLREVVERRLELGLRRPRHALERIHGGPARARDPIGGHEQQRRHLQALGRDRLLRQRPLRAAELPSFRPLDE